MRSRPITLIRSYTEPFAFRLFTTDRCREPRSTGFATVEADLSKIAIISGRHLGLRFYDLILLEISAILAITISYSWSINPRKMSTRPPGWSGRTNHSPGRNLTRLGRALVSSPVHVGQAAVRPQ